MSSHEDAPFKLIFDGDILYIGPKPGAVLVAQTAIADFARQEHHSEFLKAVATFTLYTKLLDLRFIGVDNVKHRLQITEG